MSDHQGIQDQDPAERLSAALHRIAVASERREAAFLQSMSVRSEPVAPTPAAALPTGAAGAAVAADLDGLIVRLRAVLEAMPPAGAPGEA